MYGDCCIILYTDRLCEKERCESSGPNDTDVTGISLGDDCVYETTVFSVFFRIQFVVLDLRRG